MKQESKGSGRIDLDAIIGHIRSRKDFSKVGMILTHLGIVRGTTREGRRVVSMRVKVDRDKLNSIVEHQRKRTGILDILVETREGELYVGDDVLAIVVAGDVRENVISVLIDTLNEIKAQATTKVEIYEG